MVFKHHPVLVVEDVILDGELRAAAGDGEGASGGGDQPVPGDDVDGVGAARSWNVGSSQVLSQVQVAPRVVEARGAQVVVPAPPAAAADVLDDGGGAAARGGDKDHSGVRHWGRGGGGVGVGGVGGVLPPLVHRAAARVHEEIWDCRGIEAELAGNRNLHFFRRSLGFLKEAKHIERMARDLADGRRRGLDGKREIIAFRTGLWSAVRSLESFQSQHFCECSSV